MTLPILSANSINGTKVCNHQGEDIGKIEDLMIDTDKSDVQYAVLSFGGFLGMGDKLFAVPMSQFTVDTKDEKFVLNVDKDRLENAPGFDKDNWPDFADASFRKSITSYYNHPIDS